VVECEKEERGERGGARERKKRKRKRDVRKTKNEFMTICIRYRQGACLIKSSNIYIYI
jgi:hypothetical protein